MNPPTLYCGIDVSAATLDICLQTEEGTFTWNKIANNLKGFKQLRKLCPDKYHFVM